MKKRASNSERGYSVEYVEPTDTAKLLDNIFKNIQKGLLKTELNSVIVRTLQNIINLGENMYMFTIPFKNAVGNIVFKYWDIVADMDSFEEFMHSERGELTTSVSVQVPLLKAFKKIKLDEVSFSKYSDEDKKGFGKLEWRESDYILLSNLDSINYDHF